MIGINFYMTLEGLHNGVILTNIGRTACESSSATWNSGTNSAFALGSRKTTENLDRVCRSQDLLDADCHLARSLKYANNESLPVPVLLFYLRKHLHNCLYIFFSYVHTLHASHAALPLVRSKVCPNIALPMLVKITP
jgi:hypothetical protein